MKKKILGLILGFTAIGSFGQTVYQDDFNTTDGGWTVESDTEWEWGVPEDDNINYEGDECGGSVWGTNLASDYSSSSDARLVSPIIDCSALTEDPFLSFDLYYITEACCDEGWMEFSLDNGVTWAKLLAAGEATGWYNDLGNEWWDNTNSGWTAVQNTIPGAAGVAEVKLRFHLSTDGSVQREGFAFDNMFIGTEIENIAMNGVTNISTGEVLEDPESIEISLVSSSLEILFSVDVCYTINDGTPICETIPFVGPGVNEYTFSTTEDFSVEGTYEILTYVTSLDLDFNQCNDTSLTVVVLFNPISEFPYTESFESATAFSTEGSWEIGEPEIGNEFYNILTCSPDSMVLGTVIGGDYLNSALDYAYTPIFDFSELVENPYVLFDMFRESENCCDEAWFEYTIDAGGSWSKVGAEGTGLNWYNDAGNQWWDGDSDGWKYAYHELTDLVGESAVQFRFVFSSDGSVTDPGIAIDNFVIQETEPFIVQGIANEVEISSDFLLCGFSTEELIIATFENIGSDSLIGFTVCYDGGAGLVCETLTDTIIPGGTFTYEFTTPLDLSGDLTHIISVTISSEDDFRVCESTNSDFLFETEINALNSTEIVTNVSCNGDTDGEIFVNPLDGAAGYTIDWLGGEEGFVLADLAPGFYSYTITDDNGCVYLDSAEVTEPSVIELTVTTTDETESGNGEIDLTVVGGTAPFFFDWDNDEIGDFDAEDLTNLEPGDYSVIVTDANGCTATITVSVSSVVSVDNFELKNGFKLFPNPSHGTFQITTENVENNYQLAIYNLLGEVVYTTIIANQVTTISEGVLASGTYMVELSNENERTLVKLVVQ